jgi:phage protein D/phage baseplate assembly protein gpV
VIPESTLAPRAEVRVSGLRLSADVTRHLISATVDSSLDMASMFTLTLHNPDGELTDSPLFDLGRDVEIRLGYGADLRQMMLGEITALQPSFPEGGGPVLTVSGYDKSHPLRHNEPDRAPFKYVTDSEIATMIALENGLIPIVDPSPFFHREIQQTGSDMAFLKERARANFFEVHVEYDRLHFQLPRPQTEAYVLEWGRSLRSFTPRLSSSGVAGVQVVRGYNEELAQAVVGVAMTTDIRADDVIEKLGPVALDALLSIGRRVARRRPVTSPFDALSLAKSLLNELLEGLYEGSGATIGLPDLRAGRYVTVRGVGRRFSGRYRLRRVTHSIGEGGYQTTFEVSQRAGDSLLGLLRNSVAETPSPNTQEPVYGVVVGTVTKNVDPEGRGRVRVRYPWFSDEAESPWTRCAMPMAGAGRGTYFIPDEGDEVVVAFQQGDFSNPVVLGSVWNGPNVAPVQPAHPQNRIRLVRTQAGHTITLDDTPTKERVVIAAKGDASITLSADGSIVIDAPKDLALKAKGTIALDANAVDVAVKTHMDVH